MKGREEGGDARAAVSSRSCTATSFGAWEQTSGLALVLVLPVAVWELSFGISMTVKGFKPPTGTLPSSDVTGADVGVAA